MEKGREAKGYKGERCKHGRVDDDGEPKEKRWQGEREEWREGGRSKCVLVTSTQNKSEKLTQGSNYGILQEEVLVPSLVWHDLLES